MNKLKKVLDSTIQDLVLCGYWKETTDILVNREQFTPVDAESYIRSILMKETKLQ